LKKIKKLLNKLNNNGSSMVMVIVGLAFIGIIVGALLTAVGYSYRLKLQDLNSRDNFYYVEQAMNEIYAGVGSETVKSMQDAYAYTVENMVYYDFNTKTYVTKSKQDIQKDFAQRFMLNVQSNDIFDDAKLAQTLAGYITNDSVKLDKSKLCMEYEYDVDGNLDKITIKNVVLTRTQNYSKNVAAGSYTQTISTDIEIGEPDFDVLFNATDDSYSNIFKYSMVADMGVEVKQPSTPLVVAGNVYAAADYYNKKYNESMYDSTVSDTDKKFTSTVPDYNVTITGENGDPETVEESTNIYTHGSVTSKGIYIEDGSAKNTLYNNYLRETENGSISTPDEFAKYSYNGENERSMYSGFFVDDTNVTIMADLVIVPGSVAVMNKGTFSLYNKNGTETSNAELWADNIVLDGLSDREIDSDGVATYEGSSIVLRANAYIKDDTELNAAGSSFTLSGSYYGFGDSTEKDARDFGPNVNRENFLILSYTTDEEGNVVEDTDNVDYRGHYNSSAIIINGNKASLDLGQTLTIYLAGRSYIELSKDVTANEVIDENDDTKATVSETYTYKPHPTTAEDDTDFVRDYKTGESISVKTSQLAYVPVTAAGSPKPVKDTEGNILYYNAVLIEGLQGRDGMTYPTLFERYFPSKLFYVEEADGDKKHAVPCVEQIVSGKKYYYIDFEAAYKIITEATNYNYDYCFNVREYPLKKASFAAEFPSAQYYAAAFIADYANALTVPNKKVADMTGEEREIYNNMRHAADYDLRPYLTDIGDFDALQFEPEEIILSNDTDAVVYSSGAITTKEDAEFNITYANDWDKSNLDALFSNTPGYATTNAAGEITNDYEIPEANQPGDYSQYGSAYKLSNLLEQKYYLVKWNLGHYNMNSTDANEVIRANSEIQYIDELVEDADYGEASITPINKFINMSNITKNTSITPAMNEGDSGDNVLDLASGYYVWVGYDDVTIENKEGDSSGIVRGIVITKGDVYFDPAVTSFEGLIISGGKIYVTENVASMYASPAICQAILRECYLTDQKAAKDLLNLFKGYEVGEDSTGTGGTGNPAGPASPTDPSNEAKTIDSIDYSDVCRFSNWMKNVE